ncbi:inositol monophosphatase family protein, partial [Magnetococcales bacterium HHB-1]
MNTSPTLNVAIRAIRAATPVILGHFDRRHRLKISHKGKNNPVSNADTDVEYTILNQLQRAYPDYNIMA